MNKNITQKFFLDNDHDGHWYIIPLEKKEEWELWLNLPEENEESWDSPDFAIYINGHTNLITFENWKKN